MTTLLFISLILLVLVEVLYEGHFGDKHDKESALILLWTFMVAAFLGLLIGQWQSVFTYLFIRIALFDAAFGYLFRSDIFYLGNNWTDNLQKRFPHWIRITIWATSFTLAIIINYI